MKLYNKTHCPDKILLRLLSAAGCSVRARTLKVVVKITQGQQMGSKGKAYQGWPYQWHLKNVKTKAARNRLINTDYGWLEITLPRLGSLQRMMCFPGTDAISLAEKFYKVAQHEWAHIRDFQQRTIKTTPRTSFGRRIRWEERPCEIYAMEQVNNAKKPKNLDSILLELAEWIEDNRSA